MASSGRILVSRQGEVVEEIFRAGSDRREQYVRSGAL